MKTGVYLDKLTVFITQSWLNRRSQSVI